MGLFSRFTEKTKQSLGITGGDVEFKPTSNARNVAMIDEARKFAKQLKALNNELLSLAKRYEDSMVVVKTVLGAPLPRVYEVSDKGPVPVDREAQIVGLGVNFDQLTSSGVDLRAKLKSEVLHPLEQWLAAYREIKVKNRTCDQLRLELDAQRRQARVFKVKLDTQKTKLSAKEAEAAAKTAESELENVAYKLQTEEDKVTRLTQRFVEKEAEIFNALISLIRDTAVLRQYAASALTVYEGAFRAASTAFPPLEAVPYQGSPAMSAGGTPLPPPGTPELNSQPVGQAPPAWYNEARQNLATSGGMRMDSDDDDELRRSH